VSELIISPIAEEDLDAIWFYIAEDNPDKADRYLDHLIGKAQILIENPKIGILREELRPRLRSFPVDHYLLFYRSINMGIELARVLHSSRDIPNYF
jgi:toxin ParE1/3/4